MEQLTRLLKTYDYHSLQAFLWSLAPSGKYKWTAAILIMSSLWGSIDKVFGLDQEAFVALVVIFITELVSGIWAAIVRGEPISSIKLSRFGLKVVCYLIMIAVSYSFAQNFEIHKKYAAAWAFDWLNTVLVAQVGFENTISILENIAHINGKAKDAIVVKITEKFKNIF